MSGFYATTVLVFRDVDSFGAFEDTVRTFVHVGTLTTDQMIDLYVETYNAHEVQNTDVSLAEPAYITAESFKEHYQYACTQGRLLL